MVLNKEPTLFMVLFTILMIINDLNKSDRMYTCYGLSGGRESDLEYLRGNSFRLSVIKGTEVVIYRDH